MQRMMLDEQKYFICLVNRNSNNPTHDPHAVIASLPRQILPVIPVIFLQTDKILPRSREFLDFIAYSGAPFMHSCNITAILKSSLKKAFKVLQGYLGFCHMTVDLLNLG